MIVYPVPQHLERRTKLGPFTIPEWGRLCAAAIFALAICKVTPWSFSLKGVTTVVILAPHICAAYLRDVYDLGMGHRLSGAARRTASPRIYQPGQRKRLRGYRLVDDPAHVQVSRPRRARRRRGADHDA